MIYGRMKFSRPTQVCAQRDKRSLWPTDVIVSCFSRNWRNATTELSQNSGGVSPMREPRENDTPVEKVAEMGVVAGDRLHYHH